ncbi:MAG TPA: hypothetical protein VGG64_10890 [Pirellulales bacterium]|jgi:flagellar M-ring protein FliF
MDLVNRLYSQLTDLVRTMTPRARLTAALLMAVVLASLGFLGRYELAGETTYLLGGQVFSGDEITAMQGALGKAQLNDFTVEGNRLRIPREKQAVYLAALADGNALPQTLTNIFSEATDKATWFASQKQLAENTRIAKKKGVALILRSMSGVESAEVDFDKEEPRGLRQECISTALVALKLHAGQSLSEDRAAFFQRTVAAALMMSPQDVTVVDKINHLVYGGRGSGVAGGGVEDYRSLKLKYQADYEESVHKALTYVSGITVSAHVELERELRHEETRIESDANRAASVDRFEPQRSTVNEPGGLAGSPLVSSKESSNLPVLIDSVLPLGPKASPAHGGPANDRPAQNQTTTELAGLTPRRVTISVGVPTSYFVRVWRERHAAQAYDGLTPPVAELAQIQTEEIARIREHVTPLLPGAGLSSSLGDFVTVTPFSHVIEPDQPEPSSSTIAVDWVLSNWSTWIVIAAMTIGLMTLRSTLRAARRSPRGKATDVPADGQPRRGVVPPSKRPSETARPVTAGRSLRDELADAVRKDPSAAANILRSWIGNSN